VGRRPPTKVDADIDPRPWRKGRETPILPTMIDSEALTKRYDGRPVIEDVSFRCEPGTVTGFLGPNGAGKTTTLRLLCGLSAPDAGTATVLGGGYPASGPAGRDRLPKPYLPAGLRLTALEGAGEVQTPLTGRGARSLRPGDRVYLRHAKAGELCERFNSLLLIEGDRVVDEVPTYRGEGQTFL
jgi:energy-coupling factor transporter ATP-binding protein EcfA2